MRELKFRIWSEYDKCFLGRDYYRFPDGFGISLDGKLSFVEMSSFPSVDGEFKHTIEQYTGLKDKNGREIYEGDIVQFSNFPETHNLNKYYISNHGIKIIRWSLSHGGDYPFAGFSFVNWNSTDFEVGELVDCMNIQYCVVIGNIHENPSLLT